MPFRLAGTVAGQSRSWPLPGAGRLEVGRSSRHAIHLQDPTVSKDHAAITIESDRLYVEDRGSRNGTRVNGVEITQRTELREHDVVQFGEVSVTVSFAPPIAAAPISGTASVASSVCLDVSDIVRVWSEAELDSSRLISLLAEAGQLLVLPRPLSEVADAILQIVEKFVPGSRLVLLLRQDAGNDEMVQAAARSSHAVASEPLALSRTIVNMVLNDRVSVLTADAGVDPALGGRASIIAHGIRSAMAVPLFDNDRVLGILYADSSRPTVRYGDRDLQLFTILANMAAVKIKNLRLLEAERQKARLEQEFATGAEIQRGLLPSEPPRIDGYECHAYLQSCYEVGGDMYDFHVAADGAVTVLAGDVTGKGIGAALLMSATLAYVRALTGSHADIPGLVGHLNEILCETTQPEHFVTLLIARLDPGTGTIEYVNAGHPAPLLLGEGAAVELACTAPPLGVMPGVRFDAQKIVIEPDHLLAIFSDGISEARREDDIYDRARIADVLGKRASRASLADLTDALLANVEDFMQGHQRSDDITLLLLRRRSTGISGTVELVR